MTRAILVILSVLAAAPAAHAATFTVNSPNNVDDTVCDGTHCSLREAIDDANATALVADEIDFAAATLVEPAAQLPAITSPVTINGTDDAACAGDPIGVALEGNGAAFDGLRLAPGSGGSRICALNIRGFATGDGIQIETNGNTVEACRIGTGPAGEAPDANDHGIYVEDGDGNTIAGNVISGNGTGVIFFLDADDNVLTGNFIGTDKDGVTAVPNTAVGVHMAIGSDSRIGGSTETERNVVSGNEVGLDLGDGVASGNYIGTDLTGEVELPNDVIGASLVHENALLGGDTTSERNIISGNGDRGVQIVNGGTVQGNIIGTSPTGVDLDGQDDAVRILATSGPAVVDGNAIAGHDHYGVDVDSTAVGAVIENNFIGLLSSGAIFEADTGVNIWSDPTGTVIDNNSIAGNSGSGIETQGDDTVITQNVLGLDSTGAATATSGNDHGINVVSGADGTRIGGTDTEDENLIGGNDHYGVQVTGNSTGTRILGNRIGFGYGDEARPNGSGGVGLSSNAVAEVSGNVIAHNTGDAVEVANTARAAILGNSIFDVGPGAGDIAIDLGALGPTANDPGDADAGPNGLQNFPVVTSAQTDGVTTEVTGTLDTVPGEPMRVELFSSAVCDEAEVFLGAVSLAAGQTTFSASVGGTTAGRQITATATNEATDETSELSACLTAAQAPPKPVTTTTTTTTTTTPSTTTAAPLVQLPLPVPKFPAKLRVLRNGVDDGVLDMLIEVTSRAVVPGAVFSIDYESSGRHTRFTVPITGTQVKVRKRLPSSQPKDTGITTVSYAGNSVVDPDEARLRAADGKSLLVRSSSSLTNGRLSVAGTVTESARGVVRIRMSFARADGSTGFLDWNARISGGRWSLAETLTGDAAKGGQLSIQFTGYEPAGLRGEQTAKAVP